MRRRLSLALVLVMMGACGGEVAGTTTIPPTVTTLPTTTAMATATTTASTTTTVATTSTEVEGPWVEGNWVEEPLIIASFGALGWWDGEAWFQVETDTELPVSGGEDYQLALFGDGGLITGGDWAVSPDPVPCPYPSVEVPDPDRFVNASFGRGVAISAPWNLTPHFFQDEGDDGTYSALARPALESVGLTVDDPVIRQVVRLDIQGDGVEEVIVVADDHPLGGGPGDYTVVFLREVVNDDVVTTVLESWITNPEHDEYGAWNIVSAVADLNGDSRMEVVISGGAYESWGVGVWEHLGEGLGMERRLVIGCGV